MAVKKSVTDSLGQRFRAFEQSQGCSMLCGWVQPVGSINAAVSQQPAPPTPPELLPAPLPAWSPPHQDRAPEARANGAVSLTRQNPWPKGGGFATDDSRQGGPPAAHSSCQGNARETRLCRASELKNSQRHQRADTFLGIKPSWFRTLAPGPGAAPWSCAATSGGEGRVRLCVGPSAAVLI